MIPKYQTFNLISCCVVDRISDCIHGLLYRVIIQGPRIRPDRLWILDLLIKTNVNNLTDRKSIKFHYRVQSAQFTNADLQNLAGKFPKLKCSWQRHHRPTASLALGNKILHNGLTGVFSFQQK